MSSPTIAYLAIFQLFADAFFCPIFTNLNHVEADCGGKTAETPIAGTDKFFVFNSYDNSGIKWPVLKHLHF